MTANTLKERRQYINKVKESFQNPNTSVYYQDIGNPSSETTANVSIGGFGWRLCVAVVLFAVFVYCDMNQIKIQHYTTEDVGRLIEENMQLISDFIAKLSKTM